MRPADRLAWITIASALALGPGLTSARGQDRPPTPPRQGDPWAPPRTTLPRFLASATAALCEQGLADPRGCEYRSIRLLAASGGAGGAVEVATGGWILPAAEGEPGRFAIAWSGLVYPILGNPGPGDLEADVRRLNAAGARQAAGGRGPRRFEANDEASSVAVQTPLPIKACLLLRLGRADLAEAVWSDALGRPEGPKPGAGPKLDLTSYGVSYLTLATDLARYRHDRATCAHMRGDDPLALADVRALDRLAKAVEPQAEAMGFERPTTRGDAGRPAPYLGFGQLPAFLADAERRAEERANPRPKPIGQGREARVAGLIRDLDEVAARGWVHPGGPILIRDPIVEGLIAEGDAAVEPLIHVLRSDDRLTRTVDFDQGRRIIGVAEAARTALTAILKTTNFAPRRAGGDPNGPRGRNEVADEILAYWRENRAVPIAERWYRTLLDDGAGQAAWIEAAGNITRPEDVAVVPAGRPFGPTISKPGRKPPLRGESLRKGHEPTVAALMARRVDSLVKSSEGRGFELPDACQMASMLAEWDPIAALPTLRDLARICIGRYPRTARRDWANPNLGTSIVRLTDARLDVGDPGAALDYADWIRRTEPGWFASHDLAIVLMPLVRRPEHPNLAAAASWLFDDPRSPWNPPAGHPGTLVDAQLTDLIGSPLARVPAFRALLLRRLGDRAQFGSAEVHGGGSVTVKAEGFSIGHTAPKPDREPPVDGTKAPLRVCDFYAWQLATLEAAPPFHPCWPVPRRDAALPAIVEFVKVRLGR